MKQIDNFGVVWLSLTYNCNNRCVWCYAASNHCDNREKQLEERRENEVLELLKDLGVKRTILIGGEPTLYPGIERIVKGLSERKITPCIVTNGRRFKDKEFAKRMKDSGLEYVTFSVEGSCAKIHDETTQVPGSFDECIEGIRNTLHYGINTATNTAISSQNVHDLEKLVDNMSEFKLESINFNICGVCVSEESNNQYMVNPSEAIAAFEKTYQSAKSKGVKSRLITPMPLCNFSSEDAKKAASGGPCQLVHGNNFVMDYNGDIVPCTHLTGYPMFNAFKEEGIMSREEFLAKYNNPEGIPYKFREKMSRYASTKCERGKCDEKCSGGCPLFWMRLDPEKEIRGKSQ